MCFMSSIELIGVMLSYPLVLGLEMSVGTVLVYLISPVRTPGLLATACVCMFAAVALDVLATFQLSLDNAASAARKPQPVETTAFLGDTAAFPPPSLLPCPDVASSSLLGKHDFVSVPLTDTDSEAESAVLLARSIEILADSDLILAPQPVSTAALAGDARSRHGACEANRMGIARACVAGLLLSVWPALEAIAVGDRGEQVAVFLIGFGAGHSMAFAVALPVRTIYLLRPASTSSIKIERRPIFASTQGVVCGTSAGVLWLIGAWSMFKAGNIIGITSSVSVGRCSPVVAVLWGVFFWREARHASLRSIVYIGLALVLYLTTIVLLASSSRVAARAAAP